jgi:hypothetical protein
LSSLNDKTKNTMSSSQIHYCCIATGNPFTLNTQYPKKGPISNEAIQGIFAKLGREDQLRTLNHKATMTQVHFRVSKGVLYLCVADTYMKVRVCYAFLEAIELDFQRGFLSDPSFLKNKILYYNDPKNDKLTVLQNKVDQVKEVIIEDIEKILPNMEGLEGNASKTEDLNATGAMFQKGSNKVKNRGCIVS